MMVRRARHLFVELNEDQCPVVFDKGYDVSLFGLEKLHPFDASKWGNVIQLMKEWGLLTNKSITTPVEATFEDLLIAHSRRYLQSLRWSCKIAAITEVFFAAAIPSCILDSHYLRPMRLQVGGTVAACHLALVHGWAINVGGGFHHACRDTGAGFCAYADISLAIHIILGDKSARKVLIVDVDAHQGNGHERDWGSDKRVRILDVFNANIYPHDREARRLIDRPVYVDRETTDQGYISRIRQELSASLQEFPCDIVIYNAGTDCLNGDPLGNMHLSKECIVRRDELVFRMVRENHIAIAMLTSGGYQRNNASVIATSLRNLHEQGLISLKNS